MIKAASPAAYKLLHEGTIALSHVEAAGIRVDVEYLERQLSRIEGRITKLETKLRETEVYRLWRREYGSKTKLGAPGQLGHILFNVLKHPCKHWNEKIVDGKVVKRTPKADEATIMELADDEPFIKPYLKIKKLKSASRKFLKGLRKETCNGFLHSVYSLNLAKTYRSVCDSINFQNLPVRDKEMAKQVRSCFIARDGHRIVEIDFSQIEVRVACCYNHDPRLITYVSDETKDMHRDMAAQCYMLKTDEVSKDARYCAKNKFVFPEFYGSTYNNCTISLWDAIDALKLEVDDVSLKDHLAKKGIIKRGKCEFGKDPKSGTFEAHIAAVEKDFWGNRFKVYNDWKRSWYEKYLRTGGIDFLNGFRIEGVWTRNEIVNSPIQGSAFHCLLWALIRLVRETFRYKWRSRVVGQIHDSIVADVHEDELEDFIEVASHYMTEALMKHYKWLCVPIKVDVEVAPSGRSWFDKEKWEA